MGQTIGYMIGFHKSLDLPPKQHKNARHTQNKIAIIA